MRRILSGLFVLLIGVGSVQAANPAFGPESAPVEFVQGPAITVGPNGVVINPNGRQSLEDNRGSDRDRDRTQRRDRYVCVVQPPQGNARNRPYVCNASPGRVGGVCRCSGVTGSGRLDLDR